MLDSIVKARQGTGAPTAADSAALRKGLPDIVAAKAEALKMGARLLEDWAELPPAYSNAIVIEIVDENLHPLLSIPYTDIAVQQSPTG